jgi:hypothetical protein
VRFWCIITYCTSDSDTYQNVVQDSKASKTKFSYNSFKRKRILIARIRYHESIPDHFLSLTGTVYQQAPFHTAFGQNCSTRCSIPSFDEPDWARLGSWSGMVDEAPGVLLFSPASHQRQLKDCLEYNQNSQVGATLSRDASAMRNSANENIFFCDAMQTLIQFSHQISYRQHRQSVIHKGSGESNTLLHSACTSAYESKVFVHYHPCF